MASRQAVAPIRSPTRASFPMNVPPDSELMMVEASPAGVRSNDPVGEVPTGFRTLIEHHSRTGLAGAPAGPAHGRVRRTSARRGGYGLGGPRWGKWASRSSWGLRPAGGT